MRIEPVALLSTDAERESSGYGYERNDCTVRAFATSADVSYAYAHAAMREQGRRDGRGSFLTRAMRAHGIPMEPRPKMTVARFVREVAHSGRWAVCIRGHVFAVVNGVVCDIAPATNLRCHVRCSWRVV